MLARPDATLLALPTIAMFDASSALTPSGPGCVHSGLSGMSIVVPPDLTSRPFEIGVDEVCVPERLVHAVEAVVGSTRVHMAVADDSVSTELSP